MLTQATIHQGAYSAKHPDVALFKKMVLTNYYIQVKLS